MTTSAASPDAPAAAPARLGPRLRQVASRARPGLLALPALALVWLFTFSGWRGIDFGNHWDEIQFQIKPVREMINSGRLLPPAEIYPAMTKWLVLLPAIPVGIKAVVTSHGDPRAVQAAMNAAVAPASYLITIRRLFVFVCALAIVWVYGAALAFRRKWWEATIAAAGLGLSWEYAYHARWVATDTILVQFSALVLFMLALFHRTRHVGWLYAATVAAGLGTGTKYPGFVLLVPVVAAGVLTLPRRGVRRQLLRVALLCAVAFVAYLVTTPATVLEPFAFVEKTRSIAGYYRTQHHAGHSVASHAAHWKAVLLYFSLAYFSPFRVVAVLWFGSTVLGAVLWVRADRRWGLVVVSFPVAFLMYFCCIYRVVIVRNYLVVGPFLALLAARPVGAVFEKLTQRWRRALVAAALGALLLVQGIWLIAAGEGIRHYDQNEYVREAVAYAAAHPNVRYRVSKNVRALAASQKLSPPPNVTTDPTAQAVIFFAITEGPGSWFFQTNDPWQIKAVFGPREVNFDWYCGWLGRDRVVVMGMEKAKATNVPLAKAPAGL